MEATTAAGASKKKTLDLSNHQDVADFLLRKNAAGYESASSAASSAGEEDSDNAVALPTDYVGRNNKKGDRRAVRLDEIGPRMELKLVKIVEGVPGKEGSVIYHQFGTFPCTGMGGVLILRIQLQNPRRNLSSKRRTMLPRKNYENRGERSRNGM